MDHRSIILDYSEFIEDRREGYDSELFDGASRRILIR